MIYGRKIILILFAFIASSLSQSMPDSAYIKFNLPTHILLQVNDSLVDHNSKQFLPVSPGMHSLALRPAADRSWYTTTAYHTIEIAPGDTLTIPFNNNIFLHESPPEFKTVDLKTSIVSGERKQGFRLKSMIKPALLITAVAANWGSFYMRRRADDMYSEYLATSDISKLNFYYDKASTYDQYASAALSVSVAATTTLLFVLIFGD